MLKISKWEENQHILYKSKEIQCFNRGKIAANNYFNRIYDITNPNCLMIYTFHVRIRKLNYLVLCLLKPFCARILLNQSSITVKKMPKTDNFELSRNVSREVNENNCWCLPGCELMTLNFFRLLLVSKVTPSGKKKVCRDWRLSKSACFFFFKCGWR